MNHFLRPGTNRVTVALTDGPDKSVDLQWSAITRLSLFRTFELSALEATMSKPSPSHRLPIKASIRPTDPGKLDAFSIASRVIHRDGVVYVGKLDQ